jgi:DNA topoisomerase-3
MSKLPVNLSENENKIYSMVLKSLLAALNEDHIYEATQVVTLLDESKFYSSGVVVVQNGWKNIYTFEENKEDDEPQKEKDNQTLPALKQNQTVSIADLKLKNDVEL